MSDASNSSKPFRKWDNFSHDKEKTQGVQFIWDKSGGSYSPQVGFTHSQTGKFAAHGRVLPKYDGNLDDFHPTLDIGQAICAMAKEIDDKLREQVKKDREAYLAKQKEQQERQERRSHHNQQHQQRHTGKTAKKKAKLAAAKAPQQPNT